MAEKNEPKLNNAKIEAIKIKSEDKMRSIEEQIKLLHNTIKSQEKSM